MGMPPTPKTVGEAKISLQRFIEKAQVLRASTFYEQVYIDDHGTTMEFSSAGLSVEKRGATEDATLAVAATMRFFVQSQDGISFEQMGSLYQRLPITAYAKEQAIRACAHVDDFFSSRAQFTKQDEMWSNKRVFDLFMYGHLVHTNDSHYPVYEEVVKDSPFRAMLETFFEEIVAKLMNDIFWLRNAHKRMFVELESIPDTTVLS
jgi:hypothetical protein